MNALRILVVEDEAVIAMLLDEVLVGMGHDVCGIESTAIGAVAAAARCKPDLMIVDAQLREGSGVSAVDEILRSGFVPHVFVTGNILGIQALRPNAVVIQKPYREPDLAWAMRRALETVPAR
jgi:CheY-like chemotaxis protein